MLLFAVQSHPSGDLVILFNDELKYVCAWGRWRIGPALNEPVASADVHALEPRPNAHGVAFTRRRLRRAPLRLVAHAGMCKPKAGR
jgi:hypothetical protein